MESEIISSENVRPSSPTPQNLRTYKVSMLDQIFPPAFVPIVLYFPNTTKTINDVDILISQTTQLLKRSLSVILTRFYPLAGRVNNDGQSIDCNDEGVPFLVAKFKGLKLSDLLRNPNQNLPRWLLPSEIPIFGSVSLKVQVNYFDCGGIAIGAFFSHKLADGVTIATFLESWASTARGCKLPVCPNYIVQSTFPAKKEITPSLFGFTASTAKIGRSVMRRYVFDASAISSLKSKSGVERPTRVEVVSALLWKCFMAASLANENSVSRLAHAVNLRRRAEPPFPSDCFGNFSAFSVATSCNDVGKELGELVGRMREAINKIDNDFVNRMSGDEGLSGYQENVRVMWSDVPEGVDALNCASWCGFGLYSADFGWGKPIWITKWDKGNDSESRFFNHISLMDARNGDGIEAWVTLDEKYMPIFDNVEEIRALASVDPSPLDI